MILLTDSLWFTKIQHGWAKMIPIDLSISYLVIWRNSLPHQMISRIIYLPSYKMFIFSVIDIFIEENIIFSICYIFLKCYHLQNLWMLFKLGNKVSYKIYFKWLNINTIFYLLFFIFAKRCEPWEWTFSVSCEWCILPYKIVCYFPKNIYFKGVYSFWVPIERMKYWLLCCNIMILKQKCFVHINPLKKICLSKFDRLLIIFRFYFSK